jgi:hypothetical protein
MERNVNVDELDNYCDELDNMTINELINYKVEPIQSINEEFSEFLDKFNLENENTVKFSYNEDIDFKIPMDILVMEIREDKDLYDSYIGGYQKLYLYNKDIIDKSSGPLGSINKEIFWYRNCCKEILLNHLDDFNTLTINFKWSLINKLNNKKFGGDTKFLIFFYPVGLFTSNNMLPTTVWNRLIFRYKFIENEICFTPSITNTWSNSDKSSVVINKEFNKLLFSIINLNINSEFERDYKVNSCLNLENYSYYMKFNVFNTPIKIFNYKLMPCPTEYNSYYSDTLSSELIDVNKFKDLTDYLSIKYDNLERYGYSSNIFDTALKSLYKPIRFNMAIIWWFINDGGKSKEISNDLMMKLRDNLDRVFSPSNEIEKLYYLTKIKIVSEKTLLTSDWLNRFTDDNDEINHSKYYTFNEIIHLINSLVVFINDHFYFKHQRYHDISKLLSVKKADNADRNENGKIDNVLPVLDKISVKFRYGISLYETSLKELYDRNYLSLDKLFSLERTVNAKMFFDQNEYVNYIYYLNGVLQNRYQNKNTLLYTVKNVLDSYDNDMKTLYIIGESQCGKTIFKNILLQYINEYYEKTTIKKSDFNYEDSSILKIYDDIDLMNKCNNNETLLIVNSDTYTVNINEKNKQPVKVYKDITNIVLNNDWPKINTWYHQRRVKTCLFIPNSKKSLQWIIERIFKNESRSNGSFNDVFINNFYQYLISFQDILYFDGVYYSDCINLLDTKKLSLNTIPENVKNILNLDTTNQARKYIKFDNGQLSVMLKQVKYFNYIDYYVKNKFNILF